jgi:hypothetical protein
MAADRRKTTLRLTTQIGQLKEREQEVQMNNSTTSSMKVRNLRIAGLARSVAIVIAACSALAAAQLSAGTIHADEPQLSPEWRAHIAWETNNGQPGSNTRVFKLSPDWTAFLETDQNISPATVVNALAETATFKLSPEWTAFAEADQAGGLSGAPTALASVLEWLSPEWRAFMEYEGLYGDRTQQSNALTR